MSLPTLKFTPYAWAKMIYMRDRETSLEVGAFAVSAPDDHLLVQDVILPKQEVGASSVDFTSEHLPAFYEDMVDLGYSIPQFSRIWIHTHPFDGATPSSVDETTFKDVFGGNDWAIMFVLAKTGKVTCRLSIRVGIQITLDIPYAIDWKAGFHASNLDAWKLEYDNNVSRVSAAMWQGGSGYYQGHNGTFYSRYQGNQGSHQHSHGYVDDDYVLESGAFARERALLERTSKKSGRGFSDTKKRKPSGDNDKWTEEDETWWIENFEKLATGVEFADDDTVEDNPPFSIDAAIPWIAD